MWRVSERELQPFEGSLPSRGAGLGFLPDTGHPGGCGRRKELYRRSLAVFRPRSPVRVHPRAGVEGGPSAGEHVVGCATHRVGRGTGLEDKGEAVGLRARCRSSTVPARRRTANAARVRKRLAEARHRMECGGLPPLCEAGRGETRPSHGMPSPWVETGALGARAAGGPLRGETAAQQGGLALGVPAAEEGSEWAKVEAWAGPGGCGFELRGGAVSVAADRPVCGSDQRGSSLGFGVLLA